MIGLIGKKIGMTQIYKENGELCPATALQVGPCPILQVKNNEGKDGYNAVKLGFWESKKLSKPSKGISAKAGVPGVKIMREFRVDEISDYEAGATLTAELFSVGEKVMVRGTTKGRGFAGVTKRHGFKGGDDTHGCRANRIPGSIGASSDPSRVFKGKKLPGHYGAVNHTIKGLEILMVDLENNVIFVKGAVPGPGKSVVYITKQ
ncbi:MAG: 50S ribosomal protein L3 [Candidatus Latescibacteria bacterium]|nr:50S ribosomal protein L3 [Candidatus Latescibacterota bacterium]